REPGLVWLPSPAASSPDMQKDQGTIYVFNTVNGTVHRLRGHAGSICALQFVQGAKAPYLVSAAKKWEAAAKPYRSELRLWHAESGKELGAASGEVMPLVDAPRPLSLAAWSSADKIHVALAAGEVRLRLWDAKANKISEANNEKNYSAALYLP